VTLDVLQVVTSTDRRGAEVFAVELGRALDGLGLRVRTVALAPGPSGGLDVTALGPRPLAFSTLRRLRGAAGDASIVVAHGSRTLPACALALAGTGVPFVYRNIGDPTYWAGSWSRQTRVRWMLRRVAAVVAVAPAAATILRERFGVSPERVTAIPTGASASTFAPVPLSARARARADFGLPADAPVVVVLGALSVEKDVGLAIDAIGASAGFYLLVAGDGSERMALEARAETTAPGRVHFLGSVDDPVPVYAAGDVVLLTSRTEALPAVLIEAGLQGLPVVTTDVGFVREIVVDGETGLLVSRRDSRAVATALERARREGAALGAAGRARCLSRFELRAVAEQWASVLRERGEP